MKRTDPIHCLQLGPKERKALECFQLQTVDQFLKADLSSIRDMRGCALQTEKRIRELQKHFEKAVTQSENHPEDHPVIDETIDIRSIQMGSRERRVLEHFSVQNVGDLLAFNPHRAKKVPGAGITTINKLLDMQTAIRTEGTENLWRIPLPSVSASGETETMPQPDYAEVHTILDSLLVTFAPCERNRRIFLRRIGLDTKNGEKRPILEKLAGEFGLTRERIRQICKETQTGLQQMNAVRYLMPFWQSVDRCLEAHNGFHFIELLFEDMKAEFNWQDSSLQTFGILLGFHPALVVDTKSGTVSRFKCPCLSCEEAQTFVAGILGTGPDNEKMDIAEVARALTEHCRKHCPKQRPPQAPIHPLFIRHLAANVRSVDVLGNCLVTRYRCLCEQGGNVRELAYEVLKSIGHPLHFREVAEIMRSQSSSDRMRTLKDNCVHGTLVRSDEFCCTGRGTYGLSSWNTKRYISHGQAIIRMLERTGRVMTTREIIAELTRNPEFTAPNIRAALRNHSRIKRVSYGLYSLAD